MKEKKLRMSGGDDIYLMSEEEQLKRLSNIKINEQDA